MAPSVYVIGAGNVGLGLALALREHGVTLAGVWNRSAEGRERATRLLGVEAQHGEFPERMSDADVILVAVSDAAIAEVGAHLAHADTVKPGAVVAHTSGALPASTLGRVQGAYLGSLHPVVACADPQQAQRALVGATYAVEGEDDAVHKLDALVKKLGGRAVPLSPDAKARYHAGLVLAAGLLVSLVDLALSETAAAGFPDRDAVLALSRGALALISERGAVHAQTGPVARGDVETVKRHLATLGADALPSYRALSRVALELAERRGLDTDRVRAMAALLGASS